jgi:hypothetical protein
MRFSSKKEALTSTKSIYFKQIQPNLKIGTGWREKIFLGKIPHCILIPYRRNTYGDILTINKR